MKYLVTGSITISMHVEVEADSPAEARRIAGESSVMSLCHQCARSSNSDDGEPEWCTSGELDGTVRIRRSGGVEEA